MSAKPKNLVELRSDVAALREELRLLKYEFRQTFEGWRRAVDGWEARLESHITSVENRYREMRVHEAGVVTEQITRKVRERLLGVEQALEWAEKDAKAKLTEAGALAADRAVVEILRQERARVRERQRNARLKAERSRRRARKVRK